MKILAVIWGTMLVGCLGIALLTQDALMQQYAVKSVSVLGGLGVLAMMCYRRFSRAPKVEIGSIFQPETRPSQRKW